jgi:biotin transport system substrate-specific component
LEIVLKAPDLISDPETTYHTLRMTVYAALFASLMAAGAVVAIPIGPVPIVLQNLFVLLAGLLLGGKWGMVSVGIYLAAGFIGLPVFSGGTGGIGRFAGPTGGYLVGFLPAAGIVGVAVEKLGSRLIVRVGAMVAATIVVYALGVGWLKFWTEMSWSKALIVGCYPFLPGDVIKIVVAASLYRVLYPLIHRTE